MKSSTFRWTQDIRELRKAMTFGHGFYGEPYWKEEEFLIKKFSNDKFRNTLCLGCGFFREYFPLTQITLNNLIGLDIEEDILHISKDEIRKIYQPDLNVI